MSRQWLNRALMVMRGLAVLAVALAAARPAGALIEDVVAEAKAGAEPASDGAPVVVMVRGESAISYEDARQQAVREAVERVCGVYLRSDTRVENFAVTLDSIYTRAMGFAQTEVLERGRRGESYWVIARVAVSERPVLEMLREAGLLRQWRIAVLVPETHLGRPRIPDPAAETGLIRQLTEAGYRVVDREFSGRYRYDAALRRAALGEVSALKLLFEKTRADVLVIGEAFSQRPERDPEALPRGMVSCRARVELRAVARSTDEVLMADSEQVGAVDLSEEIAGKKALEEAGERLGKRLGEKLMFLPASLTRRVAVVVSGLPSLAEAEKVERAAAAVPGVRKVDRDEFCEGTLYLDCEVDSLASEGLGANLERALGGRLQVEEISKLSLRGYWLSG